MKNIAQKTPQFFSRLGGYYCMRWRSSSVFGKKFHQRPHKVASTVRNAVWNRKIRPLQVIGAKPSGFVRNLFMRICPNSNWAQVQIMISKEGSTNIVNLVLGCGHTYKSYIEKMLNFFFKTSSLDLLLSINEYIVMVVKEGSTQIVSFMAPGARACNVVKIAKCNINSGW